MIKGNIQVIHKYKNHLLICIHDTFKNSTRTRLIFAKIHILASNINHSLNVFKVFDLFQ